MYLSYSTGVYRNPDTLTDSLDELKNLYFNICSKGYLENHKEKIEEEFYENMKNDGYLIVDVETEYIHFYIEIERMENIFNDVHDENIISILKEKLKIK